MEDERVELSDKQFTFLKKFQGLLENEYDELKDIEFEDDTLLELNKARMYIKVILHAGSYDKSQAYKINGIINEYEYLL